MDTLPQATVDRVLRMREVGSGFTNSGRPAAGARTLRAALRLAGWPDGPEPRNWLAGRVLISLGLAEAEQGDTESGLRLLDEAAGMVAAEHRGILLQNKGVVLQRAGRTDEAAPLFDAAIPLLAEVRDNFTLATALLNRATLRLGVGRVRLSRDDLRRCRQIAESNSYHLLMAKVDHDLGYCHLLAGDIPLALRSLDEAARQYRLHGADYLPVVVMDKARTLLAVGLATEAGRELTDAFELFRRDHFSVDYAWAELTRAQIALALGDHGTALMWSRRAARRFRRHGDAAWAAVAEMTTVRAQLMRGRQPNALAARAHELADRLHGLGLRYDGDQAELLSARALLAAGRVVEAGIAVARTTQPAAGTPVETRLLRRLVQAELHSTLGKTAAALEHARRGLAMLNRHRRRFGSIELRAGISAIGQELACTGLDLALRNGSARLIFDWSERCRAQAFRARPVTAPVDRDTREMIAELRQLDRVDQRRRVAELERQLRERGWQQEGAGEAIVPVSLSTVHQELAGTHAMVSFVHRNGDLAALVLKDGSAGLVHLGPLDAVVEAVRRLISDLDALSGWHLPPHLTTIFRESAEWHLSQLQSALLTPLRSLLGQGNVVVVPCTGLTGVPWGLLPDFRERAVSVVPSASVWVTARQTPPAEHRGDALLVAGPRLNQAEAEVRELARLYPRSTCLAGEAATVEATLRALDGATVAHLATHGHHEPENVLFSRLDLVDGPLLAYELQSLARAPKHVILSACDVGQAQVRTGDEILGLTAAMLYIGTITVVSSVARVHDDVIVAVMHEYHRAILAGNAPAQALALASGTESLVPLVCYGAG